MAILFGQREVVAPDKEISATNGGKPTFIYDACMAYKEDGVPLIIFAGQEYRHRFQPRLGCQRERNSSE